MACKSVESCDPMDVDEYGHVQERPSPSILILPNELLLWIGGCLDESSLAAMMRTSRLMSKLLSKELYAKAVDFEPLGYKSVVQWAAEQGQVSTIQKVFEQIPASANWTRVIADGIMAAIEGNKVNTLKFVCQHRMSLIYPLNAQLTPISLRATLKARGIKQVTSPVNIAAHRGRYDVLKFLLESGVSFYTSVTRSAAMMFEGGGGPTGDTRVAQLLIRHGFDVRMRGVNGHSILHDLASRGSIAHVDLLAATAPEELDHQDSAGRTPLMHAILARNYICAIHMVTVTGADVTLSRTSGTTALHMAAQTDQLALVETLVSHGANLNAPDENGMTALHLASLMKWAPLNEPVIMAILLNAGAFCSPVDRYGRTPLSYALATRQPKLVDWLMMAGAKHHAYEFQQSDGLLEACRLGCMEVIEMYAKRPGFAMEMCEDPRKRTALHMAAAGGQARVMVFLLANWRDVDRRDLGGRTALWHASRKPSLDCANLLIHAGASVDAGNLYGCTPLMGLTRHTETPGAMTRFLRLSKNVEWADDQGMTVLHHAARNGNLAAATAIVGFRASLLRQLDSEKKSPLVTAVALGRVEVSLFLKQYIALSREDYEYLMDNGFFQAVAWVQTGPEWASTRESWPASLEEEEEEEEEEDDDDEDGDDGDGDEDEEDAAEEIE